MTPDRSKHSQTQRGANEGLFEEQNQTRYKNKQAEHVREEHARPSESQRLKEAIVGTEDLTGMLEASVPSGSHSFPGDFCAFAEPPGRCHPCLEWQQTRLFKGKCYGAHLMTRRDSFHLPTSVPETAATGRTTKGRQELLA